MTFTIIPGGGVTAAKGFTAAGLHCGIKYKNPDLGIIYSRTPAQVGGVFTTNRVHAACIDINRNLLELGRPARAVVVNSGNANACTGEQGRQDSYRIQAIAAEALDIDPEHVYIASTGVIGVPLPMEALEQGIPRAVRQLDVDGGSAFSEAILTTDVVPKECAVQLSVGGRLVSIGGAAKGSGMIHPNMATMLSFIATDANLETGVLQPLVKELADQSFNMISVDGDTSTNDMALVLANGEAGNDALAPGRDGWDEFKEALLFVFLDLAKKIARDGEGATKLMQVTVKGAASIDDARHAARTVTRSPLVKTAVYGADANWGRILCAVGYADIPFDPEQTHIHIGPIEVYAGRALAFDEQAAREVLSRETVDITIDLRNGSYEATAYGCDLTEEYVNINASYRS